ncbi:MAG: lysophospholipid acyltransferase family protein [Bacteroidales bacterium]|nr:lysophospholipid acyltransferase family protein [Bacteroidales bacterium]
MATRGKLIETDELVKAAKLNRFAGSSVAKVMMTLLRINKINKLYEEISSRQGMAFIEELIQKLEIEYEVREEELQRIPREGAFITVSNHPFGGIDGMLLVKVIAGIRPDIKLLANFLLQRIEPISEFFLSVNPFDNRKKGASSIAGIKMAIQHIQEGMVLGLFPAGEVSSYNQDNFGKTDREWQIPALKMIKRAQVPVVPVYFEGTNSRIFHILGLIHPSLRTVKLPSEIFNKRHKKIRIRIGHPISVEDQNEFTDLARYGRYLRAKTYALGSALEVKRFFLPRFKRVQQPEPIAQPVPHEKIISEINALKEQQEALLFSNGSYEVYCTSSIMIPEIIYEIGRLRELTFRAVGEGTNRSMDLDEYDLYYNQLFVWDNEAQKIVGAYRIGIGDDILERFGIRGFYIQSLFRISRGFRKILRQSVELGRSFVIEEYQKKPMPLFLLWKGILYFLIKNDEHRYLIGPVSISSKFSEFSKSMIINFIKKYFYNRELAKYIRPRVRYNVPGYNLDEEIIFESADSLQKFDKFIDDVETSGYKMPVLLKRYLKLNGRIIGFNVDPKFNNSLDGLLILDLFDVPVETIASLSKELNDETILERFEIGKLTKGHF